MKFEPKSREELSNLLPEGQYEGYVRNAEEKTSTTGNPMIVLQVEVYDAQGNKRLITDRLILIESMQWKLYDFCESAGIMDRYEIGEVEACDCLEKTVHCKIVRKPAKDDFPEKNEIKSYYLPKKEPTGPVKTKSTAPVAKARATKAPVSSSMPTGGDVECPF
jgi:hypothetical protein